MTTDMDVVSAYANELGSGGDFETAVNYLSHDFQNFYSDGKVALTKESVLGMGRIQNASFTDYGFVLKDVRE